MRDPKPVGITRFFRDVLPPTACANDSRTSQLSLNDMAYTNSLNCPRHAYHLETAAGCDGPQPLASFVLASGIPHTAGALPHSGHGFASRCVRIVCGWQDPGRTSHTLLPQALHAYHRTWSHKAPGIRGVSRVSLVCAAWRTSFAGIIKAPAVSCEGSLEFTFSDSNIPYRLDDHKMVIYDIRCHIKRISNFSSASSCRR